MGMATDRRDKNRARHKAAVKHNAATRGTVLRTDRLKPILTTRACLSACAQKNSKPQSSIGTSDPTPQKSSRSIRQLSL
jgi:hypothetical protein